MTCDDRKDLFLLYVADALDVEEARELENHLATGCPVCAGSLAEAQSVFASLGTAADAFSPPPALKQVLMDRIDRSILPAESDIAKPTGTADFTAETATSEYPSSRAIAPSLSLFRMFISGAVAAGIAVVLTHYVMTAKMRDTAMIAQHQQAFYNTMHAQDAAQIQFLESRFQSQQRVMQVLQSPQLKLVQLQPTDKQTGALARLLWDQKNRRWEFLATGMAKAPQGQTYELWFVPTNGAPVAAGTFDVNADGIATLGVDIPPGLGELKLAAVTNEKTGGSPTPTGQFQVAGSVQ